MECSNNLFDVPFEENEGSVMDYDEGDAGSVTLNSVDIQDFLEGNEEEEATSISISSLLDSVSATGAEEVIVDDADDVATSISISSLLDSVSSTGPPNVVVKEEIIVDDDQLSRSQPLLVSRSELSAIEAADARFEAFEAQVAISDHVKLLQAAEVKRISELPQATVSETSTDSSVHLSPLQEYLLKVRIDAIRLREEEREAEEIQAFLDEQELSVTQCSGYGVVQEHFVINRVIEGLLPNIPSMQLTHNWLTNTENNFNVSIF